MQYEIRAYDALYDAKTRRIAYYAADAKEERYEPVD